MTHAQIFSFVWLALALFHLVMIHKDAEKEKTNNLVRFYACLVCSTVWAAA